MATRAELRPIKDEFLNWLCLDKHTRKVHGLPSSEREFAEWKGMSPRTLRNWKGQETFQVRLEQRKVQLARQAPGSAVSAVGEGKPPTDPRMIRRLSAPGMATEADHPALRSSEDAAEAEYLTIKQMLVEQARSGDRGALELYFKTYGKTFVEREEADRESSFADLSDDELADEVLPLIGRDRVAAWLEVQE